MKHAHSHSAEANVKVELPTQELEDLVSHIAASAVVVIGFYMASDTVRSIIKASLK